MISTGPWGQRKSSRRKTCLARSSLDKAMREGTTAERAAKNSTGVGDVCMKNGSRQGQSLALTVLFVPNSSGIGIGEGYLGLHPTIQLTSEPGQWLQCQANGSNVCRAPFHEVFTEGNTGVSRP